MDGTVEAVNCCQQHPQREEFCGGVVVGTQLVWFYAGYMAVESVLIPSRSFTQVGPRQGRMQGMCGHPSGLVCLALEMDDSVTAMVVDLQGNIIGQRVLADTEQMVSMQFVDEREVAMLALQSGVYWLGRFRFKERQEIAFMQLPHELKMIKLSYVSSHRIDIVAENCLLRMVGVQPTIAIRIDREVVLDCLTDEDLLVMLHQRQLIVNTNSRKELTYEFPIEFQPLSLFKIREGFGVTQLNRVAVLMFKVRGGLQLQGSISGQIDGTITCMVPSEDGMHYAITALIRNSGEQPKTELFLLRLEPNSTDSRQKLQGQIIRWFRDGLQSQQPFVSAELNGSRLLVGQFNHLLHYSFNSQNRLKHRYSYKLPCAPLSLAVHPLNHILACGFRLYVRIYMLCEEELVELRTIHRSNAFVRFLPFGELVVSYSFNAGFHQLEVYRSVSAVESSQLPLVLKHAAEDIVGYKSGTIMIRTAYSVYLVDSKNSQRRHQLHTRDPITSAYYHQPTQSLLCAFRSHSLKCYLPSSGEFEQSSVDIGCLSSGCYISSINYDPSGNRVLLGTSLGQVAIIDASMLFNQRSLECCQWFADIDNTPILTAVPFKNTLIVITQRSVLWQLSVKKLLPIRCLEDDQPIESLGNFAYQTKQQLKDTDTALKNAALRQNFGRRGWKQLANEINDQYELQRESGEREWEQSQKQFVGVCSKQLKQLAASRQQLSESIRIAQRDHQHRLETATEACQRELIKLYEENTSLVNYKTNIKATHTRTLQSILKQHRSILEEVEGDLHHSHQYQLTIVKELKQLVASKIRTDKGLLQCKADQRRQIIMARIAELRNEQSQHLERARTLVVEQFQYLVVDRESVLSDRNDRLQRQINTQQQLFAHSAGKIRQLRHQLSILIINSQGQLESVKASFRGEAHNDRFCSLATIRTDVEQKIFQLQDVQQQLLKHMTKIQKQFKKSKVVSRASRDRIIKLQASITQNQSNLQSRELQSAYLQSQWRNIIQRLQQHTNGNLEKDELIVLKHQVAGLLGRIADAFKHSNIEELVIPIKDNPPKSSSHKLKKHLMEFSQSKLAETKLVQKSTAANNRLLDKRAESSQQANCELVEECKLLKVGVQHKKKILSNRQASLELSLLNTMHRENQIIKETPTLEKAEKRMRANQSIKQSLQAWQQFKQGIGRARTASKSLFNREEMLGSIHRKVSHLRQQKLKNKQNQLREPFEDLVIVRSGASVSAGNSPKKHKPRGSIHSQIQNQIQPQIRRLSSHNGKSRSSTLSTMYRLSRNESKATGQGDIRHAHRTTMSAIKQTQAAPTKVPVPAQKVFKRLTKARASVSNLQFKQEQ